MARILPRHALPTRSKGPALGFGGIWGAWQMGFLSHGFSHYPVQLIIIWICICGFSHTYLFLCAGCMNQCHATLAIGRSHAGQSIVRIVRRNFGICRWDSMSCELSIIGTCCISVLAFPPHCHLQAPSTQGHCLAISASYSCRLQVA